MAQEKAVIGWPTYRSKATYSTAAGGSWQPSWPLTNMKTMPISLVARSTTQNPTDTRFQVSFAQNTLIQMLALIGHNLTIDATVRYRLYGDAARSELLYDTGAVDVWPRVYPFGTLPWGDPRWWSGKYSAEQIAQYNACTPLWLPSPYLVRAFDVELNDPSNPDGWVQIGLLDPSQGWQFSANPDVGAQYGFRARSRVLEALGGTEESQRFTPQRVWQGTISYLDRDEALARGFDFMREADLTEPFVWMVRPPSADDPRAAEHLLRTCFFARNLDLPLSRYATQNSHDSMSLNLKEVQ